MLKNEPERTDINVQTDLNVSSILDVSEVLSSTRRRHKINWMNYVKGDVSRLLFYYEEKTVVEDALLEVKG